MNMRKIIAVLAAVLMLCSVMPLAVFAAPGDVIIEKNFDDGSAFSNGSNENGYMVFDATTADWANVYLYANAIKNATKYEITFDCKANKATNINVKINDNWTGDTAKWTTNVTTEWETYSCVLTSNELKELTATALLMFTSNTYASSGAIYHIDNVVVKEYLDPAIIGAVLNGDFETGDKSNWSGSATVVAEGYNGGYAAKLSNPGQWSSALTQTIPVEANTVYEITWMSKRLSGSGAFNLIACQSVSPYTNYTKVAGQNWMNETSGNWVNNSFTINTGDNTSMLLKFTTETTNPGEILLDNIKVSKVKDPSFDGYITNGDFETGKTTPWDKYSSTAVTAEAAKDGDYGMMLSGGGASYGGIANQNFTVVPGKTYTVRFDMKVINAGVNVQIKDNGANVGGGYISKTEWTTYTYDFTPNYANANLNFCGSGIAGTDVAYLDNVMVYEKVEESNDGYIKNGTLDTGNSNRWSLIWSNQVAASVITGGKDSTFAVQVSGKDTQLWGQFRQSVAVEPNTDYKVTVWAKNSSGMSLLIKNGDDSANINNVGANAGEEWTQITNEFNSGNNTSVLVGVMVNVAGASGIFDTFVMEKLHTCEIVELERVDATCGADGYVKYGCECGEGVYTETLTATGEHTYDHEFDTNCNVCDAVRDVVAPVSFIAKSVSEDVNGHAVLFDAAVEGIVVKAGTFVQADFTNATYNGYKLLGLGVKASNGVSETTIEGLRMYDLEEGNAKFAFRIINIPEEHKGDEITMTPYYVVEIDGVETTLYGEAITGSYAEIAG
ncbi:MAG: carbohydrate binding domain-containing protein [Clostridia bacterium]|nr:carbohydrate binding domain-containing protein [Clostridia bacterium]